MSRKRQRGEPESSPAKCILNTASYNVEGSPLNVQQRLESTRQQFLQLTVRLKELLHRTEQRYVCACERGRVRVRRTKHVLSRLVQIKLHTKYKSFYLLNQYSV